MPEKYNKHFEIITTKPQRKYHLSVNYEVFLLIHVVMDIVQEKVNANNCIILVQLYNLGLTI